MQDHRRHRKRRSTSKVLLLFFIVVALVLTALTVRMARSPELNYEALSVMERLTEVWYGGLALVVAFYMWKAKNENRHKYSQQWLTDIGEKYGWEAAARFAEIDLKGD